jgi:hypothetical protein
MRREELGLGFVDEEDMESHAQAIASAKAVLGDEAFAAAWARGEAMTDEDLVAFTMPS